MRRNVFLGLVLVSLVATYALAHYPGVVKIDQAAKKQPAVTFNHAKHGETYAKSCDTCHHNNKGLKREQADSVNVKKCAECHLDPAAGSKAPSMREMGLTKNPMHIRCISCHKEQKKGPTACNQCHKK